MLALWNKPGGVQIRRPLIFDSSVILHGSLGSFSSLLTRWISASQAMFDASHARIAAVSLRIILQRLAFDLCSSTGDATA